jgi:excisionase family DNA binding protein
MTLIGLISAEGPIMAHPVVIPEPLLTELLAGQKEVFDLREAAAFLKLSDDEVVRLVKEQGLPARQVGDGWRFLKAAICDWLRAGAAGQPSRKEMQLAIVGSMKGDPYSDGMLKEIYRKRGRPMTEDAG